MTFMGDAVLPRGGSVALTTLSAVLDPLGVGGNVVRTALSRLGADGWVERRRVGRHSFYRLGVAREQEARAAAAIIYAPCGPGWDGVLHVTIGSDGAMGSALLAPGVWLAPTQTVAGHGIRLRATAGLADARAAAALAWPPARLADSYTRFILAFGPLQDAVPGLTGLQSVAGRLLMVHQYRRLVLREPGVPEALRPADWPGPAARALCAGLYRALLPESERWLDQNGLMEAGGLPEAGPELRGRFLPLME